MSKEVVSNWSFDPNANRIIPPLKEDEDDKFFRLTDKTIVTPEVFRRWWDKKPIAITFADRHSDEISRGNYGRYFPYKQAKEVTYGKPPILVFDALKIEMVLPDYSSFQD